MKKKTKPDTNKPAIPMFERGYLDHLFVRRDKLLEEVTDIEHAIQRQVDKYGESIIGLDRSMFHKGEKH